MTVEELQAGLDKYDKGVLKKGAHKAGDREFCVIEFSSIMRGKPLSDQDDDIPDIRVLNDAFLDDDTNRTKHMLPVLAALWNWKEWSKERKAQFAKYTVIATINRIVAELPNLPETVRLNCKNASTFADADAAAGAAGATARCAALAADASARCAAAAAAADARVRVLAVACQILVSAAKNVEHLV